MSDNNLLFIKGEDIHRIFFGRELEIIDSVRSAYATHSLGNSCLPHSAFVRFPNNDTNRIIALPAYVGGDLDAVGIKWIASFPGNVSKGLERASATLILNSTVTGLPMAIMEGSIISAKRTAASVALAVQLVQSDNKFFSVGLIGCGLINFEVLSFLLLTQPTINKIYIYDLDLDRSNQFAEKCRLKYDSIEVCTFNSYKEVCENTNLVSFATTAIKPYVNDLRCTVGTIILNISLRDLHPNVILSSQNIVDDVDHVCRAHTSAHLAEQIIGNRSFIDCTIGDILLERSTVPIGSDKSVIFSPFGLGVLDIALAKLAYRVATEQKIGIFIEDFIATPWFKHN